MLKEIKINNKCIRSNSNVKTEKRKLFLPNVMCMRTQEAMNGIRGEKPMTQDVLVVTERVNPREKKLAPFYMLLCITTLKSMNIVAQAGPSNICGGSCRGDRYPLICTTVFTTCTSLSGCQIVSVSGVSFSTVTEKVQGVCSRLRKRLDQVFAFRMITCADGSSGLFIMCRVYMHVHENATSVE